MAKAQIFLVFACDAWKNVDSKRLVLVTTSKERLKSFIADEIRADNF